MYFLWLLAFVFLFLYRYVRLVVNCISYWTIRPMPIPPTPSYFADDVTVLIPSLDGDTSELREMISTVLATDPFEIILVTIDRNLKRAMALANDKHSKKIRVLSVPQANKRIQLCRGIPEITTAITVLADDDVFWPKRILPWILAPFEDPGMGGVVTCQSLRRANNPSLSQRLWGFLGAMYLVRRNFDCAACAHIDGGLPCLSGRTVAYRTSILQDENFKHEFTHETWRTYQLNADDDNFMTRWMVRHGWKTWFQDHKEAEIQTTLEDNPRFMKQCLRWSRSNWRSNWTSMFVEGQIWTQQPWSLYAVHQTTLTAWALPTDLLLFWLLYNGTEAWSTELQYRALAVLGTWMLLSKTVKLIPHVMRYPIDIVFLPVSIVFGWTHNFLKLYAMCTLRVTTWGSRENADADDSWRMIPPPRYALHDDDDCE